MVDDSEYYFYINGPFTIECANCHEIICIDYQGEIICPLCGVSLLVEGTFQVYFSESEEEEFRTKTREIICPNCGFVCRYGERRCPLCGGFITKSENSNL